MPLTRELRNDAYKIYLLIGERDMPSNNTAERLVQRSALPQDRVLTALDLLWADDTGFIRVDTNRSTGERGYFVDPSCRKKTPLDLDALYALWEAALEDAGDDDDEDDEGPDEDDEWAEMDADDGDD